jgi:hypothetical protein
LSAIVQASVLAMGIFRELIAFVSMRINGYAKCGIILVWLMLEAFKEKKKRNTGASLSVAY